MKGLILIVILLFPLLSNAADNAHDECIKHHCIAVVDAGSTGSRLHIYSFDYDKTNTPVHISEIWNRKAIPGIATIEHEHRSISNYLDKLFTDAPPVHIPVYFYSTAGMRLLPKTHHKNLNQLVSDWFDRQYYWRLASAKTVTGMEEGIFAWLAVNYQLKLLDQNKKPLVGVMDIGGASVQIVIPLNNKESQDNKDIVRIPLYGTTYTVFAHSFLGLGQNEMSHQYFDLKYCYPDGFELPSGQIGKGNAQTCREHIAVLVNQVHKVHRKISEILKNNSVDQWVILGGITYLLNDKVFGLSANQFTNSDLIQFTDNNLCKQSWSTLEQKYPNNFMLYNYCMLPSYLYALLVNGYGFSETKAINFLPLDKTADWTIGVVLQHRQT